MLFQRSLYLSCFLCGLFSGPTRSVFYPHLCEQKYQRQNSLLQLETIFRPHATQICLCSSFQYVKWHFSLNIENDRTEWNNVVLCRQSLSLHALRIVWQIWVQIWICMAPLVNWEWCTVRVKRSSTDPFVFHVYGRVKSCACPGILAWNAAIRRLPLCIPLSKLPGIMNLWFPICVHTHKRRVLSARHFLVTVL
jgi:hypothetical protein